MKLKSIGYIIAIFGAALFAYELFFSYCREINSDLCFFALSPTEPGVFLPLYSFLIFVFGLLIYFGAKE
ncbi:MAG TPA: hypothetical protein VJG83_04995 [archaeon]|nr:hypothetical protein [archaeon]